MSGGKRLLGAGGADGAVLRAAAGAIGGARRDFDAGRSRCAADSRRPAAFERVDEVCFFEIRRGRITRAWGLKDTDSRLKQLGLLE